MNYKTCSEKFYFRKCISECKCNVLGEKSGKIIAQVTSVKKFLAPHSDHL